MDREQRRDGAALTLLAAALLVWYAAPGIARAFVFPIGPDAPVYLWWARLVGVEGLSAVTRPGVPALSLVLSGALNVSLSGVLAALEIAGGVLSGIGAAVLLRFALPRDRVTWLLGGALSGTFASHIATGYLATLVFAILFLASAAAIATGTRRGAVAAALLLGAGAVAHPRFLAVGAAIYVVAALAAWRDDRDEAKRWLGTAAGAAALLGVAGATLLIGPSPLLVDTSRDAFLRRAGLDDVLHGAYLSRFVARWPRYAPWGVLPLIAFAFRRPRTAVERLLAAWIVVSTGGALFAVLTRLLPVDRFVTFAFALPMVAGVGATAIARSHRAPRAIGLAVATGLVLAMFVGAAGAWLRQEPFVEGRDLAALRAVNSVAAAVPDSALVFPMQESASAFSLTLAGNAIRATVPPRRIADVVVVVSGPSDLSGQEADAIRSITARDESYMTGSRATVQRILVLPLAEQVTRGAAWVALEGTEVHVDPAVLPGATVDAVDPYSPWLPAFAAFAILAFLGTVGAGWAAISGIADRVGSYAIAPAMGLGVVILVAFAAERSGVTLSGSAGPIAISAFSLGSGLLARLIVRRDRISG